MVIAEVLVEVVIVAMAVAKALVDGGRCGAGSCRSDATIKKDDKKLIRG